MYACEGKELRLESEKLVQMHCNSPGERWSSKLRQWHQRYWRENELMRCKRGPGYKLDVLWDDWTDLACTG